MKKRPLFITPFSLACIVTTLAISALTGCVSAYKKSIGGDLDREVSRVYLVDFDSAWQAVMEATKGYRQDVINREGGFLQTKWHENTAERNFTDSFGSTNAYLKAQVRYKITVAKGYAALPDRHAVKVTIGKEQQVQQDVLEGWRPRETDDTEENTLLYRIGRLIFIHMKMAREQEEKTKKALSEL